VRLGHFHGADADAAGGAVLSTVSPAFALARTKSAVAVA
jgi:hypothetical protein